MSDNCHSELEVEIGQCRFSPNQRWKWSILVLPTPTFCEHVPPRSAFFLFAFASMSCYRVMVDTATL